MKKKVASLIMAFLLTASAIVPCTSASAAEPVEIRHSLSKGVQNIVKRAHQMTEVKWTPVADIKSWGGYYTYKAGTTYTGLPYSQAVYSGYVPWSASLDSFIYAVNHSNSKMYVSRSTYGKDAPYYGCDCSAFVSWAWNLSSRANTRRLTNYATAISSTSYEKAEVGDCLCQVGSHIVMITDITYGLNGKINGIEISESTGNTPNVTNNYCCQVTWYGSGHSRSLSDFNAKYFGDGYVLYRCNTRDKVTYTHSCAAPIKGDRCSKCGYGMTAENAIDIKVTATTSAKLYAAPNANSAVYGYVNQGDTLKITAFANDNSGVKWYKTANNEWISSQNVKIGSYIDTASVIIKSISSEITGSDKSTEASNAVAQIAESITDALQANTNNKNDNTKKPTAPFTDISKSGYCKYIVEAYSLGIVNGYSDGTFRPNEAVSRGQFITMLYRAVGSPKVSGQLGFADNKSIADAYKSAVIWGYNNGIIQGYSDNTFRPDKQITRAQMATFMYRYMKNIANYDFGSFSSAHFRDVGKISKPYFESVSAIVSVGIMNGTGDGSFQPDGTANRGMSATVMLRMYKLLNK